MPISRLSGQGFVLGLLVALAASALAGIAMPTVSRAAEAAGVPNGSVPEVPWGGTGCKPQLPGARRTSATCGAVLEGGNAVPPPGAPATVKAVIAAANQIDRRPYVWGGGHLSFWTHGYDCSGAVGFALHGAGLLETTTVSGQLAAWGAPGVGRWITIYANAEHVYMVIAGLRYDTRDDSPGVSGPRWHTIQAEPKGFAVRHPVGL